MLKAFQGAWPATRLESIEKDKKPCLAQLYRRQHPVLYSFVERALSRP